VNLEVTAKAEAPGIGVNIHCAKCIENDRNSTKKSLNLRRIAVLSACDRESLRLSKHLRE
jgi:hypothetical protein